MLEVTFLTMEKMIFEGRAKSVILPGEKGVFEILSFHKNFFSRLLSGWVIIDNKRYHLKRGIVKVDRNRVTIIGEPAK
ncbi:MAG: hypothetical protein JW734_01185 [Candidatus Omnitrophica bacterium]|nr:hypothetical protein [Candidatus Omnitrophota bacterium]